MIYALIAVISIGTAVATTSGGGSDSSRQNIDRTFFEIDPATVDLEGINATDAYQYLTDNGKNVAGDGVTIAITDTGVQLDHPDLDDNILGSGHHEASTGGMVHGTHVAGIAAAENNGVGITGVAYNASILAVNIIETSVIAPGDDGFGLSYSVNNGAKVINASWGFGQPGETATIGDSTYESYKLDMTAGLNSIISGDAVLAIASGNDGYTTRVGIPAVFAGDSTYGKNIIAVGSIDSNNTISSFTNQCSQVQERCIVAPGRDINSTLPGSTYGTISGTSMATPHVAGAAAVLRSAWPSLTAEQTIDILLNTATDLGKVGTDSVYGRGALNLFAAVQADGGVVASGSSVNSSGYTPESSSIISNPIFGDSFTNNINPIISKAVFFDNWGRDYKANLDQRISALSTTNINFEQYLFNEYQSTSLPLNFGKNDTHQFNITFNATNIDNNDLENIKFSKFGIKNLTIDKSVEDENRVNINKIKLSYVNNIDKDLKFGFTNNDFQNQLYETDLSSKFGFYASQNPFNDLNNVSFSLDPENNKINKKQFFVSQNISPKFTTRFSFAKNYETNSISNLENVQSKMINSDIDYKIDNKSTLSFGYGNLDEYKGRFLGSQSLGAFSNTSSSTTNYFKVKSIRKITNNLSLVSTFNEGTTKISGNETGIFKNFSNIRSRGYSVALLREKILKGRVGIIYSEPLSVYKGSVDIDIPISRNIDDSSVNRLQENNVSLKPNGQEKNLEAVYQFNSKKNNGEFELRLIMKEEAGNVKDAKNQYYGVFKYRLGF